MRSTIRARELADNLERAFPPSQQARFAGKLDMIRHGDSTFDLQLPAGGRIRGIAPPGQIETLPAMWGKSVLAAGKVHFGPAGKMLRIEAEAIRPATEKELELWGAVPAALESPLVHTTLRVPQGSRSGLNAVVGKWPGDEDDEHGHGGFGDIVVTGSERLLILDTNILVH